MGSRKMVLMNLLAWQRWRCRHRADLWKQWEKERVGEVEDYDENIHITRYKIESQWELAV